jgi:hypothetical protein
MRITIEVPYDLLESTVAVLRPSVTAESGAVVSGSPGDALSGGAATPAIGGAVAASLHDASSAGPAEQASQSGATGAADDANDGGPAPT